MGINVGLPRSVVFWTTSTIKDEKSAAKFHYIKTVSGRVVAHSIAFQVVSIYWQGDDPFPLKSCFQVTCHLLSMNVSCARLSWHLVNFWAHVQTYTVSYRTTIVGLIRFLWSPYVIGQTIIFSCCGLFFFFFFLSFFSSPNLSSRRLDVYHTSAHGVVLV